MVVAGMKLTDQQIADKVMGPPPSKGLMHRGAPSTQTSARLAGAILREFGKADGLAVLDWLIERLQAAENITKEKSRGKRR